LNIAIIGASGAIGSAFVKQLAADQQVSTIQAFARSKLTFSSGKVNRYFIDLEDEVSIQQAADKAAQNTALDRVIVASGLLHQGSLMPEKALKDLCAVHLQQLFAINAIGPALVAKYFLPKLSQTKPTVFAALSARVGSISDNRLGGWYGYRASKAALNMLIKTASIEMARRNPQTVVAGLHPGTVASQLSQPFQKRVPAHQLFTPDYAVAKLLMVINQLTPKDSGKLFAWDGQQISY
jgi:NAD(P)-dependent dehydrogenase (short-subunit alcohol dehydrogenase family)